jgi:hypothetical protein
MSYAAIDMTISDWTAEHSLQLTAVRLKVEQNQLIADIDKIAIGVARLKCL